MENIEKIDLCFCFSVSLYNTYTDTGSIHTPHFLSLIGYIWIEDGSEDRAGWVRTIKRGSVLLVKRGSVLLYPKNPKPKDWDQTHSVTYPYTSKWVDSPRNLAPDKMPNVKMGSLGWSLAQQNGLAWIGSCWKTKNSCQWWKEWNKPESIGGGKKVLNTKNPKY